MNKNDLVAEISEITGETKVTTTVFLNAFIATIESSLVKGDKIALVGFGTFSTHSTAAREGRNPATGEKIKISAATKPKFTPGSELKKAVNHNASK